MVTTELCLSSFPEDCLRRYEPERLAASGGFGSVFIARERSLSRLVAIKVLHQSLIEDVELVERFELEARVTAALSHPHIVKVMDFGVDRSVPWIAFEYLEGRSLRAIADGGELTTHQAVDAVRQVGEALDAAHGCGVLHRDIKPENVLEAEAGVYKLTDFGIAKWAGVDTIETQAGLVLGTPAYLAPECIQGQHASPRTDLYALGIMLFELLAGRLPFWNENPIQLLEMHLKAPVPRPSSLRGTLPRHLDEIVARALAKNPADRYPVVRDLLEDLRSPQVARGPGRPPTVAVDATRSGREPSTAGPERSALARTQIQSAPHRSSRPHAGDRSRAGLPHERRSRRPVVALALAVVALVAVAIVEVRWSVSPPDREPLSPSASDSFAADRSPGPRTASRADPEEDPLGRARDLLDRLERKPWVILRGPLSVVRQLENRQGARLELEKILRLFLRAANEAATSPKGDEAWQPLIETGLRLVELVEDYCPLGEAADRAGQDAGVRRWLGNLEGVMGGAPAETFRRCLDLSVRARIESSTGQHDVFGQRRARSSLEACQLAQRLFARVTRGRTPSRDDLAMILASLDDATFWWRWIRSREEESGNAPARDGPKTRVVTADLERASVSMGRSSLAPVLAWPPEDPARRRAIYRIFLAAAAMAGDRDGTAADRRAGADLACELWAKLEGPGFFDDLWKGLGEYRRRVLGLVTSDLVASPFWKQGFPCPRVLEWCGQHRIDE